MSKLGRRHQETAAVDTRPGKILVLALLALAPIAIGFVLAPLFTGGNPATARPFIPYVLYGSPILAAGAVGMYATTKPVPRSHRASRIGLILGVVALLLWALVLALSMKSA